MAARNPESKLPDLGRENVYNVKVAITLNKQTLIENMNSKEIIAYLVSNGVITLREKQKLQAVDNSSGSIAQAEELIEMVAYSKYEERDLVGFLKSKNNPESDLKQFIESLKIKQLACYKLLQQTVANFLLGKLPLTGELISKCPSNFIECDWAGKLSVAKEVKEGLSECGQHPFVFAGTGDPQSGSSFFLDQISNGKTKFAQPRRNNKSIQMEIKPFPDHPEKALISLDITRNNGDDDDGDDPVILKLMVLYNLMSNVLAYTTKKETPLQGYRILRESCTKSKELARQTGINPPKLALIQSDNSSYDTLKKLNEDGLNNMLQEDNRVEEPNLQLLYPNNNKFTLCWPVQSEEMLAEVFRLKEPDIVLSFKTKIKQIQNDLLHQSSAFCVGKDEITVAGWLQLVEIFVGTVNRDAPLDVSSVKRVVQENVCNKPKNTAVKLFRMFIQEAKSNFLPMEIDEFINFLDEKQTFVLGIFGNSATPERHGTTVNALKDALDKEKKAARRSNEDQSQKISKNILEKVFQSVKDRVQSMFYWNDRSGTQYTTDFNKAQQEYFEIPRKGPMAQKSLSETFQELMDSGKLTFIHTQHTRRAKESAIAKQEETNRIADEKMQQLEDDFDSQLEQHNFFNPKPAGDYCPVCKDVLAVDCPAEMGRRRQRREAGVGNREVERAMNFRTPHGFQEPVDKCSLQ